MATSPNLDGYREATKRKRAALGEPILFLGEVSVTFPPGTPTDPETGRPHDPVLVPTASARASATLTCEVSFRTLGHATFQESDGAFGWVDQTDVMLIADVESAPVASGMVEFERHGTLFAIRAQKFDGIAGIDRYLIWGSAK